MIRINGTVVAAGEKKKLLIPVPGEKQKYLEVFAYAGKYPGKTLVISAGMHGNEYIGIEALIRIMRFLDPKNMHGNLIVLPLINPCGFYQGLKQTIPEDGKNLNRVFPGNPEGSYTEKLAYMIEREIYPLADFILDLHGGDANEDLVDLAFCNVKGTEEVTGMINETSKVLSVPYLVESHAVNGLYSWAVQKGVPGILLERGGRGAWEEEEILKEILDIEAVMYSLGIFRQEENRRKEGPFYEIHKVCHITEELLNHQREIRRNQKMIHNAFYVDAASEGFWYPQVNLNSKVEKGMRLGFIMDMDMNILQEVIAETDGMVMYYTVALGVAKGTPLIAYGEMFG